MANSKGYPFQFTGSGGEYFRVWIVNLALTLVTLGIYSAWAKVRTQRWFYGHTLLDGQAFSYLATPMQILKGRLIAVAALAVYFVAETLLPMLAAVLFVVFVLALGWIVVNALRFNSRQSAYRGLRFDFDGSLRESWMIYSLGYLALIPTLGLIYPYLAYRHTRFRAEHTHYGNAHANYGATSRPFWGLHFKALLLMLGYFFVSGVLLAVFNTDVMTAMRPGNPESDGPASIPQGLLSSLLAILIGAYLMFAGVVAYLKARSANLLYNHTTFGSAAGMASFECRQRARDLLWLYLSNLLLIALTFGLFIPWAKVRLARYRASRLQLIGPTELAEFAAGARKDANALGGEVADVFDLDIGFT